MSLSGVYIECGLRIWAKKCRIRNREQLLDTPFWLKPWLKTKLFDSSFSHLTKVLATTISVQGLALEY